MKEAHFSSRRPGIRAAMFVDFDNVYTGLQALDPLAAKRFAEDPKHWSDALAAGGSGENSRRFLIRNCYLNPVVYSKYRTYWTRAGFRVIDCPSLTQRGKSSTDINLVLDAMDTLSASGEIDEFFIASADADFTSLIQRFRAADKMTTVIAAGAVAFAYREMADSVVESHDFVAILNGTIGGANPCGGFCPATTSAGGNEGKAEGQGQDRFRCGPGGLRLRSHGTGPGCRGDGGPPRTHGGPLPEDGLGRLWKIRDMGGTDQPGRRIHGFARRLGLGYSEVLQ